MGSTERGLREEINRFVDAFGPNILGPLGSPTTEDELFQAFEKCKVAAKVANAHYPESYKVAVDQRKLDRQILNSMLDDTMDFHIASLPQSTQARTAAELDSLRNELNAIFSDDGFSRLIQKCQNPANALGCPERVAAISQVGESYEVAKCYDDLLRNLTRKHEALLEKNAKAEAAARARKEQEEKDRERDAERRKRIEKENAAEPVPKKFEFKTKRKGRPVHYILESESLYSDHVGDKYYKFDSEKSVLRLKEDRSECTIVKPLQGNNVKVMVKFTSKGPRWAPVGPKARNYSLTVQSA